MADTQADILYGINPIAEALKTSKRKCFRIILAEGKTNPRLESLIKLVRSQHIKVESLPKGEFKKRYRAYVHQGIIGYFSIKEPYPFEYFIQSSCLRTNTDFSVLSSRACDITSSCKGPVILFTSPKSI